MPGTELDFDEAVAVTRTGDLWLFRGRSAADRAIRVVTNSPVNHVGMAVVIEDLPPLMWHAELGKSLPDVWSGSHHRGAQLHDLRQAVLVWTERYHQRVWLRQLDHRVTAKMEDAALRTIALAVAQAGRAGRRPRVRLLRRDRRVDLRSHGPAAPGPAAQLVRPGSLLERRPPRPGRRGDPG